ncbi:MAG: alpha/beta hydrolase [Kineosporiaceae bacterium]
MPIQPGAEEFRVTGGPTAVLVLHGFTGSPRSIRPWAEGFAAAGFTVHAPRLPGHGTSWQELNRTRWQDWYAVAEAALLRLRADGHEVVVAGLSAGGGLAVRLAQTRPDDVRGLVVVNPSVRGDDPMLRLLPVVRWVLPSVGAIGDDIARPGVSEGAYPRTPLHAAWSLTRMWREVRADLDRVRAPMLVFVSAVDNVVPRVSTTTLLSGVASRDVTVVELSRSRHVATLDHEADLVVARSVDFARRVASGTAVAEPA